MINSSMSSWFKPHNNIMKCKSTAIMSSCSITIATYTPYIILNYGEVLYVTFEEAVGC